MTSVNESEALDVATTPGGSGDATSAARLGGVPNVRRLLVLLGFGVGLILLIHVSPLKPLLGDIQQLRGYLEGDDLWAEMLYLAGVTAMVALGAPRLAFYVLAGVAFDFWEGLLLAQAGVVLGSLVTFQVIRWGGREWVLHHLAERWVFRKAFLRPSSVGAVVLIRQLPITCVVINIGLALGHVRVSRFIVGSFLGFLPQGVIATLIGSGLADDRLMDGVGQILAAAAVGFVCAGLFWRWSRQRRVRGIEQ